MNNINNYELFQKMENINVFIKNLNSRLNTIEVTLGLSGGGAGVGNLVNRLSQIETTLANKADLGHSHAILQGVGDLASRLSTIETMLSNKSDLNHTHTSVPYAEVSNISRAINPLNTAGNGYEESNFIYFQRDGLLNNNYYRPFCIVHGGSRVQCSARIAIELANF